MLIGNGLGRGLDEILGDNKSNADWVDKILKPGPSMKRWEMFGMTEAQWNESERKFSKVQRKWKDHMIEFQSRPEC